MNGVIYNSSFWGLVGYLCRYNYNQTVLDNVLTHAY